MVNRSLKSRGYTLIEVMVVVAIIGIIASMASTLFTGMFKFYNQTEARTEVQQELRVILANMDRIIRQGSAGSFHITEASGQPPYSQLTFYTLGGSTVTYSQSGHTLTQTVGIDKTTLTTDLQYIAFSYPQTDINSVISISITLQKATFSGQTTALQMAVSKVRVMNP